MSLRKFFVPVVAGLVALAFTPKADAAFFITITQGADSLTVFKGDPEDGTPADPDTINIDVDALNASLLAAGITGIEFTSLGVDGNFTTPGAIARLDLTGRVQSDGTELDPAAITIIGSASGYTSPNGPRLLSNSSSINTTLANGSTGTFDSFYDPTDTNAFPTPFTTPTAIYTVPTDAPFSDNTDTATVGVGFSVAPFSLTNVMTIDLAGNNDGFQFIGSAVVTAIPEPASMAMLLVGGSAFGLRALRRRKTDA